MGKLPKKRHKPPIQETHAPHQRLLFVPKCLKVSMLPQEVRFYNALYIWAIGIMDFAFYKCLQYFEDASK